ncbi:hypothetical protein L211DRAFT_642256 [Terfezia boudieri ATCC MYA-4762]|uniref:Uncharacterized protein n=1 Tax=Terfezia boudieri ATCC MYA-4762 TaxID=1051890 RepID=A0A3N4L8H9_9PEZI|nr:hypothetical protein L211DRAFT_642256 [Terfezia boudieri ATCC MYA-4762]
MAVEMFFFFFFFSPSFSYTSVEPKVALILKDSVHPRNKKRPAPEPKKSRNTHSSSATRYPASPIIKVLHRHGPYRPSPCPSDEPPPLIPGLGLGWRRKSPPDPRWYLPPLFEPPPPLVHLLPAAPPPCRSPPHVDTLGLHATCSACGSTVASSLARQD